MQTLFGSSLKQHAANPQAPPALVSPDRELSFAELDDLVDGCAAWLLDEGCRPSEVVGITIGDELMHLVVSQALLRLGLPQVCLPTYDPPAARLDLARRLALRRLVVTDEEHALAACHVSLLTPGRLAAAANGKPCAAIDTHPDAPAVFFTSSGTTGNAKIVALTQRMLARRGEHKSFTRSERMLMLTTVEDYPAKCARSYCVQQGLTSVFPGGASSPPLPVHDLCTRFGVTRLDVSVLQASDVGGDGSAHRRLPASVKVFASGSRVPGALRHAYSAAGRALFIDYGSRETGSIANTWPEDRDAARETVGVPRPWVDLEIVDDHGNVLPPGEAGEIRVRSPDMIDEYWRDADATARHFRDGWFHPGDIGSLTASGALCVHGRVDDMMNLNSIKIFPAEIERVLEAHPAVKTAAAFSVPSALHGDIPVAAVELHDAAEVGADELMAHARQHLGLRTPRRIVVVAALPRNASGKVVKRDLVGVVAPGH